MAQNRRELLEMMGGAVTIGALAGCVGVSEQTATPTSGGGGDEGDEMSSETSTPQGPTGTAAAWYQLTEDEKVRREDVIETFNQKTRQAVKGTDLSELQNKLQSAVPSGQGPQTFEWAHDLAGSYAEKGFLAPQSDQIDVNLDQFTPAASEAAQYDGELIGLPHSAETVGLLYNKELVDSPPSTLAEMQSIMEEYHAPEEGTYGLSYPLNPYFYSAWAQAFGGYYFDHTKDPQLGLTNDETVKGFQLLLDEIVPYQPEDPSYEAQVAPFLEGNAPFAINGPWFLASTNKKDIDVGVTALPTPEGGEPNPYTGITLWYFAKGMEKDDGKSAAARRWAEWYCTNEDLMLDAAEKFGAIPVLSSLSGSDDLPPKVKGFSQAVEQGYPMPAHPKMNNVWGPVGDAFMKAFNGSASVHKAMQEAESTIRSSWE